MSRASLLLLISHGLAGTLASAGVGLGALSSYGQTLSVTNATVTANIDESLDVIRDVAAKVTLHAAVMLDVLSEF